MIPRGIRLSRKATATNECLNIRLIGPLNLGDQFCAVHERNSALLFRENLTTVTGSYMAMGLSRLGSSQAVRLSVNRLLPPDWFIVMFTNLSVWADHIRKQTDSPTTEYALEVETRTFGNPVLIGNNTVFFNAMRSGVSGLEGHFPKLLDLNFPRYSLGSSDEIPKLLALFHRDFWNALGIDAGQEENNLIITEVA